MVVQFGRFRSVRVRSGAFGPFTCAQRSSGLYGCFRSISVHPDIRRVRSGPFSCALGSFGCVGCRLVLSVLSLLPWD